MIRRLLVAATAAGALAMSACGAEEASVVKTAFEQDIKSANLTMDLSVKAAGQEMGFKLTGPYQSNGESKLPSADLKLNLTGMLPQPIEARVISTGDDAFVVYGGETYQVGKENIAKLGLTAGGGSSKPATPDVAKLLTEMRDWFPETSGTQDAELNGEPVTRISGKLDLSKALADMKNLSKDGVQGFEGLSQLKGSDLKDVAKSISDPNFTLDVGKSDGKLRRVAMSMKIKDGTESGTVALTVQLSVVDKPVKIDAPSSGRPIEELMQKLGQDFGGSAPTETTIS